MSLFVAIAGRRLSASPIGFRLIDDLTAAAPLGRVTCVLDARTDAGTWVPSGVPAARSASGIVIFPGLGRTARRGLSGAPPRRFRARFAAEFYIPLYAALQEGLEFDAPPYNDEEPPPGLTGIPQVVVLVPAPNHPFPPELRVLRGAVRDAAGPVAHTEVSRGNVDRVLTDTNGEFALPLRLPPRRGAITVDATDHRTGRAGQLVLTLPAALDHSQLIALS